MKPLERLICRVIGVGVIGLAVATFLALSSTPAAAESNDTAIRPFRVTIPEKELVELRRRIEATRWPTKELVEDRSQGVQLTTMRELARYWTTDYDWRKAEAKLNALPQFVTKIDGVDIHFIHVRSRPVVLGVLAGTVYPGLAYFNEVDRGGHFAAWEEPALFASELRAAFKPLR